MSLWWELSEWRAWFVQQPQHLQQQQQQRQPSVPPLECSVIDYSKWNHLGDTDSEHEREPEEEEKEEEEKKEKDDEEEEKKKKQKKRRATRSPDGMHTTMTIRRMRTSGHSIPTVQPAGLRKKDQSMRKEKRKRPRQKTKKKKRQMMWNPDGLSITTPMQRKRIGGYTVQPAGMRKRDQRRKKTQKGRC